jgi:hypothetical protein
MGHDIHFLERLERVSDAHMELAMSLYKDGDLVRAILRDARIPEQAERVAITLEDPEHGPFIIVARDGHFVTCLGKGMNPGELPLITRQKLDGIAVRVERLREQMEIARSIREEKGRYRRLLARMMEGGDTLTREEFVELHAWVPWLAHEYWRVLLRLPDDLKELRHRLRKLKAPVRDQADRAQLRSYWQKLQALGHLLLLCMSDEGIHVFHRLELRGEAVTLPSWVGVRQGLLHLAVRGAWAAGQLGKPALPTYKLVYATHASPTRFLDAGIALMAIGLRQARSRAEVEKALAAWRSHPVPRQGTRCEALAERFLETYRLAVESPEGARLMARQVGVKLFLRVERKASLAGKPTPEDLQRFRELYEEVPEDVALATMALMPWSLLGGDQVSALCMIHLMTVLPWAVRAKPADFYLPASWLPKLDPGYSDETALQALSVLRDYYGPDRPARAAPTPGRNDRCSCGSGKKFKHCCLGKPA